MGKKESDLLKKLLATFKIEAEEHLRAMSSGLLELEKAPRTERQMEVIETIFREAHSLKGAARAVDRPEIEAVCQSLESTLARLKRQDMTLSPELLDTLHQGVDRLGQWLSSGEGEPATPQESQIKELSERFEKVLEGDLSPVPGTVEKPASQESSLPEKPSVRQTVRISTAKLDSLLRQAEELLSAKLTARQRAAELGELQAILTVWKKEWAKISPEVRTIQRSLERDGQSNGKRQGSRPKDSPLLKLLEFFERESAFVKSLESQVTELVGSAEQDLRSLGGMVDTLLEDMKTVLLLPFSSLLEIFPKLVRDLSRDRDKEVSLVIQGGEIEIDRRILEEMKDPLIHLIRNCIDHGVEKPPERERKQKSPRATVTIAIAQKNGNKVEMLVSDDGAGVDVAKVRSAALKLGLVSREETEKLSEPELLSLLFQSGVSTSPLITDLSGRGLGLAIVREKVEKLGGAVSLETRPDAGTTIRMILPLTLATFRGIVVRVGEHLFVVPATYVERVVAVRKEEIKTVENRETLPLNGKTVALVRLAEVLELPQKVSPGSSAEKLPGVVLGSAEKRIAFLVDEICNEQEVLVKSLGKQLARVRNIAGATVLGTGKVAPILNVPDLMNSAIRASAARPKPTMPSREAREAERKSVLVVEDSITARTLLKNILEAAGYDVKTAVDGVDAFTELRSGAFDIVVSDVDMPRMGGFDLTAKIRADQKLSELPVVLVTALEAREDRERGIDVGANAYLVKSSFDQSNLLEAIRRLV